MPLLCPWPLGRSAKFPGQRAKPSSPVSRSSNSWRRLGMVVAAETAHNCKREEDLAQFADAEKPERPGMFTTRTIGEKDEPEIRSPCRAPGFRCKSTGHI